MKVCVLSSGSKGNSVLIMTKNTKVLIDLGVTKSYVEDKLREIEVDPKDIKAILITHTHTDHIQGLKVFLKKYHPTLYVNKVILHQLKDYIENFDYKLYEDNNFTIEDINVNVIKTSHDVKGSVGFVLENNNKSVVYVTDTGYINKKYFNVLKNRSLYVFESNHDVEMLMNGSYPFHLKKRIIGDKGHLSNVDSSYYLSKFVGENTKTIILAHLSDDNNTYEKAEESLTDALKSNNKKVKNIIIAKQKQRTDMIEV